MTRRIALFGGSFNPPGLCHLDVAEQLAARFDEVVVVPCGPRPDKETTNDVETVDRAAMSDMMFRRLPRVRVDLFDLEQATFTPTRALAARYAPAGDVELWHVVWAEHVAGGGDGRAVIQRRWDDGAALWRSGRFVVAVRGGDAVDPRDLPPHHILLCTPHRGTSEGVRERFFRRERASEEVTPEVLAYIERRGLYRGGAPRAVVPFALAAPRPLLFVDDRNPAAVALAARIAAATPRAPITITDGGGGGGGAVSEADANCVAVVGGDGTMVRAIRTHWRLRLPLYGINAGHRGFLLNRADGDGPLRLDVLVLRNLPLLYVEALGVDEKWRKAVAFNDAWVMCSSGQSAWVEVRVNGEVRLPRLVGDGVLVSTAAGSTAYARAMGAAPVPAGTPTLLLVGSNVMEPPSWRWAHLPLDAHVELTALDPKKRPLHGFVDGVPQGEVLGLRVRVSRIAAVELAFRPEHDLLAKLAQLQFPQLPSS